ncbi:eukaryotic translation initiation factor 4E transporter-like [Uloborus diversus]|uniref:eukaryotic translation initiation factor 4E transporter-like n=1 Tax=Uloborus diversus TaxID=327109 RepID=UPI00240A60EA|nr:eukaryotic translation initiation factor 4E transporter-like [Uloborus diversus]
MAMVRQLTESELINGSTPEDDSHSSEHMECYSRPQSCASSGSKRDSPSASLPQLQYSKEDLMKFSTYPLSQNWPSCLDPAYNNSTGKWDPERWFMNHRSDRVGPVEETRSKRERQDDSTASHKRKSSDPKERIKDEKDDIVLSPQRRSFGTGCHVIQQSSLARRPGSPTDSRDLESFRDPSRRIGSGRIMTRDRDQRDWERDREYGYNSARTERRDRFDQEDTEKDVRRYSSRYNRNDRRSRGRDRIDEVEPEWFSGGPTSQSETIELVGFEDPHHEDETRKPSKKSSKRAKQNSRRSSLKSEEGEKIAEQVAQEDNCGRKGNSLSEEPKNIIENKSKDEEVQNKTNAGFDLDELFRMDWIPGFLPNESPPDNVNNEIGCSRFSQWFRRESPLPESGNNSRRSSLHEELIANVLNSITEPQIIIPSPVPNSSDNFFAPISPAISQSSTYSVSQSGTSNCSNNKDIMKMLQSVNTGDSLGEGGPKGSIRSVKELEADLKRIVLGEPNQHEERSAFDKLLRHMSDSRSSPTVSMSMGPLDKSKALQEQDILQDILGGHQTSISPMLQQFQMFKDDKPNTQPLAGGQRSQYNMSTNQARSEMLARLVQQQKQEQHLQQVQQQQIQQQQIQNHLLQQAQQPQNVQGFTVDMLAKILGPSSQAPLSPVSPGVQQSASAPSLTRNEPQMQNSVLQYQRQRELLSSILKQQQHSNNANLSQPNLLQTIQQRRCPSSKEIPVQQTLGLPTLGISPRQSPLPPEAISSAIPSQGRIPSPLVFGQQPPALSHAPAPIHPAAIVQAMAQNAANPNTLQVQNPVVLQRVPSPQELAVHTQSILQNALIKRKLEEQKENFRKRQEAQRTSSPIANAKNGTAISPLKGLSPTIAFTPTSVMRKIHSEKTESKEQKISMQNGNKAPGAGDIRIADSLQNTQKLSSIGICTSLDNNIGFSNSIATPHSNNANQVPRAVHGQALSQPRSIHGMNSGPPVILPGQGRPIVKVGLGQGLNSTSDISRTSSAANKASIGHNKSFMSSNNQANTVHHEDPCFDSMGKFQWHHQLSRQQSTSSVPQLQMAAATYAALNHRPPPALNPHHPNILRPVNMASPANVPASNINFPLLRNAVQNPIRGILI